MSWETVNFEDAPFRIIDGDRGKNYPKQNEFSDKGYCLFLSATNVTKSGFSFSNNQFVTQEKHDALRKGKVERGDVILTTRGTLGNVALYSDAIPFPVMRINSGMVTIKPDQAYLTSEYLYHFLRSELFQAQVRALQSGVAQPQLPIRDIKKIQFKYPNLPTQKRIARVLSAYDNLIENNRRRIALLEEAARLIYREWFVHFRFPNHENVKFKNGLPLGWEWRTVASLLTKLKAKPKIKKDAYLEKGTFPCVDQGQTFIGGFTNEKQAVYSDILPLIVFGDHTRALKFIDFPFARGADGTQVLYSNNERLSQECFYLALREIDLSNYFYARHFKFLKETEIVVPSQELGEQFTHLIKPNFEQISKLRNQNQVLTKARNMLLPRLMDGRITI